MLYGFDPFWAYGYPLFRNHVTRSFPFITANTHFLGFSEMPYFRQRSKICFRSNACYSLFFENIVTSLRYTTTLRPIRLRKSISMALWKVYPTLISPKGILLYAKVPNLVLNVVFNLSSSATNTWLQPEKPSSRENNSEPETICNICSMGGTG